MVCLIRILFDVFQRNVLYQLSNAFIDPLSNCIVSLQFLLFEHAILAPLPHCQTLLLNDLEQWLSTCSFWQSLLEDTNNDPYSLWNRNSNRGMHIFFSSLKPWILLLFTLHKCHNYSYISSFLITQIFCSGWHSIFQYFQINKSHIKSEAYVCKLMFTMNIFWIFLKMS